MIRRIWNWLRVAGDYFQSMADNMEGTPNAIAARQRPCRSLEDRVMALEESMLDAGVPLLGVNEAAKRRRTVT